ncbi:MAG TPA: hypothetical protein VGF45_21510 [Polyangia bacterium]
MPRTSSKLLASFLAAAVGLGAAAPEAFAKKRRTNKAKPKAASTASVNEAAAGNNGEAGNADPGAKANQVDRPRPGATSDADSPRTQTSPPKPRVYTFGGLDVNGNLKAPQLLFFRGRVKQELDTSSPEKRSFLKELEKTADAKGL